MKLLITTLILLFSTLSIAEDECPNLSTSSLMPPIWLQDQESINELLKNPPKQNIPSIGIIKFAPINQYYFGRKHLRLAHNAAIGGRVEPKMQDYEKLIRFYGQSLKERFPTFESFKMFWLKQSLALGATERALDLLAKNNRIPKMDVLKAAVNVRDFIIQKLNLPPGSTPADILNEIKRRGLDELEEINFGSFKLNQITDARSLDQQVTLVATKVVAQARRSRLGKKHFLRP